MVKVKHTSLMVCSFVYCRQHYIPSPTLYPIALYPITNAMPHRIVSLRQRWQNGHFRICPPLILRLVHLQTLRHIQKRLHVPVARYRLARCLDINIFSPGAAAE